jgi:hypothetical protein
MNSTRKWKMKNWERKHILQDPEHSKSEYQFNRQTEIYELK